MASLTSLASYELWLENTPLTFWEIQPLDPEANESTEVGHDAERVANPGVATCQPPRRRITRLMFPGKLRFTVGAGERRKTKGVRGCRARTMVETLALFFGAEHLGVTM